MMGPLNEALGKAAREGKLTKPHDISEDDWRARLAALYPDVTLEQLAAVRAEAERLWADGQDDDFGV